MNREQTSKLFRYEHLPDFLQVASKPFHELAVNIIDSLPPSEERTLAIRSLWEAKNLTVYAVVDSNKG